MATSSNSKKLKVTVLGGRNLIGKNTGNKSDPYCEVVVLDDQGNKLGKSQCTKVIKDSLTPTWNQLLEFTVGSSFAGLKLRCWDKHKFRTDKFMGQVTIKFNPALLSSTEQLDDWFALKKRKANEEVSGDIHLQILYGDLKGSSNSVLSSPSGTNNNSSSNYNDATKNRSHTIVAYDQPSNYDLRVSANFHTEETNNKLKTSTHVVIDEDEDEAEDKKDSVEYERVRDGPSTPQMEKFSKDEKDLVFALKNLEISNNSTSYYNLEFAKCNVRVNGGKWYFEAKITTAGQMQIGWCSATYSPKSQSGDAWSYDGSKQQKFRNNQASGYGEYWATGDIIGCAIDLDGKTIQYWRNGKDMGVAFNDVTATGGRLCPFVGLSRRTKIVFNFGKDPFLFPATQDGYNILHSFLSEKEIDQLTKLFIKYRDIGNQATAEERQQSQTPDTEVEFKDTIHGAGLLEFQKDLGVTDDEDPLVLMIAFKLKTETLWEISREEFMNAFTIAGCATIEKIRAKVREWQEEIRHNNQQFKAFYNFVFDYLKEDKKILLTEEAVVAWNIVLKDRKWNLYPDFLKFLEVSQTKAISRDAWQQLWHFMAAYPQDLKEYDAMSSWPILYDEFVEWMEKEGKK